MSPAADQSEHSPAGAQASILVVDDDALVRTWLRQHLEGAGYAVDEARSASEARARMHGPKGLPDVILLDQKLPSDGMGLLRDLRARHAPSRVIMITGDPSFDLAVDAMSEGAEYYLSKPVALDRLLARIELALAARGRGRGDVRSGIELGADPLVARSVAMLEVKALLEKVARAPSTTVLLTGESGVGKDAAARFLHRESQRADQPFVNITCSALPASLLESELFGHERGAFTDAKQRKVGLLELAAGGSVFLDEIGEMGAPLQAKLLRFLEDRAFRRVGGSTDIRPDVRVIAATNRSLQEAMREGSFREDLYYRLAVLHVHIPPLRERSDDVELLARYFIRRFGDAFNKRLRGISLEGLEVLARHPWPGNVRELKNAIERAVLMTDSDWIGPGDIVLEPASERTSNGPGGRPVLELPRGGLRLDELEQELLVQALERTRGNKTRAALLLGLTRDQIRHRIEKYGLEELPLDDTE